jgi:hypothetical protein
VDGPEFDGLAVDFAELSDRLTAYRPHEKISFDRLQERHECRLDSQVQAAAAAGRSK